MRTARGCRGRLRAAESLAKCVSARQHVRTPRCATVIPGDESSAAHASHGDALPLKRSGNPGDQDQELWYSQRGITWGTRRSRAAGRAASNSLDGDRGHMTPTWLTLAQAAARAQVAAATVRREIKAGRIRAARVGGRRSIRLRPEWVDAWLDAVAQPIETWPPSMMFARSAQVASGRAHAVRLASDEGRNRG